MSAHEIDFEADAAAPPPSGLEGLGRVSELSNEALLIQDTIDTLEGQVKGLKARLTAIIENELPDLFTSLGMAEFKLDNGAKVKVAPFVRGSIPKDRALEACAWLREHGHGGLIRRVVAVQFGPGDDEKAKQLVEALEKRKLPVVDEQTVHHSTLASWAREMKEKGADFPADLLGLYIGRKATIK